MRTFGGWRIWVPLYLLLTLVSGFVDFRVRAHPEVAVAQYIPQVVAGSADAPGLYRVLAPFTFDWLRRASGAEPMTVWHATRLAWFMAAWLALHAYFRTWFSTAQAVSGVFITAALLPLTYTNSWPHPDHIPELALFTLGCLAVARQADGWFLLTLVVATLNRETAVFLVVLYALAGSFRAARLVRAGTLLAVWAFIYAGLRGVRGLRGYDYWQFWRNLDFLGLLPPPYDFYYRIYAWFGVVLAVTLLFVGVRSRSTQPLYVRRAVLVVPVIFLVSLTISSIIETRILTPVIPLMMPALMCTLGRLDDETGSRPATLHSRNP